LLAEQRLAAGGPQGSPDPELVTSSPDPELVTSFPDPELVTSFPDPELVTSFPDPELVTSFPDSERHEPDAEHSLARMCARWLFPTTRACCWRASAC
jgi:hypothetical protein